MQLTSWTWAFLERPRILQPFKNFPAFYGTRKFPLLSSWTLLIQPTPPYSISPISFIKSSIHLRIVLPSVLAPSSVLLNNLYAYAFSSFIYATCPIYLVLSDLIFLIILGEEYKLRRSLVCSFLHTLFTSSHFDQNIPLSTLFSYTFFLWSSLNVRNQVLHPYRSRGQIMVMCI
jgi:hypothetical protein